MTASQKSNQVIFSTNPQDVPINQVDEDDIERQVWFCETCHMMGVYVYSKADGVCGVTQGIIDQHESGSVSERFCVGRNVRLLALEFIYESTVFVNQKDCIAW